MELNDQKVIKPIKADRTKKNVSNQNTMDDLKNKGKFRKVIKVVAIIILMAASAAGGYYAKQTQVSPEDQAAAAKKEVEELVEAVGKLIVLPTDESPTIATVNDPEKLKSQSFFVNAKQGDKVLIYTNAKKAILFDPVANKILEVAPLNIGTPTANSGTTPTPAPVNTEPNQ